MIGPVRTLFAAIETLIDRILCVCGAVLFSQFPEYVQQYLQRLGGHLDEARRQLDQFRDAAARTGSTLAQLAASATADSNPSVARLGGIIVETQARVQSLSADQQAIREASVWSRPFVFLHHLDPQIARAALAAYRPAVPTTLEGLIYAAVGMVVILSVYHGCIRVPLRRSLRRRPVAAPADAAPALRG